MMKIVLLMIGIAAVFATGSGGMQGGFGGVGRNTRCSKVCVMKRPGFRFPVCDITSVSNNRNTRIPVPNECACGGFCMNFLSAIDSYGQGTSEANQDPNLSKCGPVCTFQCDHDTQCGGCNDICRAASPLFNPSATEKVLKPVTPSLGTCFTRCNANAGDTARRGCGKLLKAPGKYVCRPLNPHRPSCRGGGSRKLLEDDEDMFEDDLEANEADLLESNETELLKHKKKRKKPCPGICQLKCNYKPVIGSAPPARIEKPARKGNKGGHLLESGRIAEMLNTEE